MKGKGKKQGKISKAVKKYVHKIVDNEPEKKQWAIQWGLTALSQTVGSAFLMNLMSAVVGQQGVGDYNRIGSKIKVHAIEFKCTFQIAATTTLDQPTKVRIIQVIDKKADGVILNPAELLYDISVGQGVNAPYNYKYRHEFEILSDRTVVLENQSGQVLLANTYRNYGFKHKFKHPKTLSYYTNANAQTVASIEGPAIYTFMWAERTGINMVDGYSSMEFTDS